MLSQEDIFFFLEDIAFEMRKQNIPILNDIKYNFPRLMTRDEIRHLQSLENYDSAEENYSDEEN